MFADKEKEVKDSKGALERIKYLEEQYSDTDANLIISDGKVLKLEKENALFKEKLVENQRRGKY